MALSYQTAIRGYWGESRETRISTMIANTEQASRHLLAQEDFLHYQNVLVFVRADAMKAPSRPSNPDRY